MFSRQILELFQALVKSKKINSMVGRTRCVRKLNPLPKYLSFSGVKIYLNFFKTNFLLFQRYMNRYEAKSECFEAEITIIVLSILIKIYYIRTVFYRLCVFLNALSCDAHFNTSALNFIKSKAIGICLSDCTTC